MVWSGLKPGVYDSWSECRKQIFGVKGARYKSFKDISYEEAVRLYKEGGVERQTVSDRAMVDPDAIAVDASCRGNPGPMEYRGVVVETGDEVFHSAQVYPKGTNNIGEFLAIVHALALMERQGYFKPIYSDSRTAIGWVFKGKCMSKLVRDHTTETLWQVVDRAEAWLAKHSLEGREILKWDTNKLGEIPADFGRK